MTINGVSGAAVPAGQGGGNPASDPVSKALQKQIANTQRQIQEISADKEMTTEEKTKRRQELQQQIQDLNNQLRQHQIELRREKQQNASDAQEAPAGAGKTGQAKGEQQASGLSATGMNAMLSADSSIRQAKVQGSVAAKMEGRAGVLKIEIKLDGQRGGDTSAKKEELADAERKADNAVAAQLDTLAGANQEMKAAAQTQKQEGTADKAADKDADGETDKAAEEQEDGTGRDAVNPDAEKSGHTQYVPIDVRL